jgi:cytochrome c oxidase assembly protein subunit 15
MEWFHRVVAGGFAIASLVLGHKILRSNAHRQTFFVMMLAVVLLLTWQIILGALTVLELLNPGIVAWHLMNAVLLYTIIEIIGIKASAKSLGRIGHVALSPRVYRYLLALTMAIFIQLFIGGMVASNEAGLMCPDFPTCFGSWWPRISWLSSLQMVHRFAGFSIIVFAVFVLFALRQTALPPAIRKTVSVMPALLALQILLGAINVMWHLPAWASVMHLALALVMYALLVNATAVCRFCYSTDSLNLEAESVAGGLEVAKIKA